MHAYIHTYIYTCIHTYTHAYMHTYIHTFMLQRDIYVYFPRKGTVILYNRKEKIFRQSCNSIHLFNENDLCMISHPKITPVSQSVITEQPQEEEEEEAESERLLSVCSLFLARNICIFGATLYVKSK